MNKSLLMMNKLIIYLIFKGLLEIHLFYVATSFTIHRKDS